MTLRLDSVGPGDLERLARLHSRCFPGDPWDVRALTDILMMPAATGRYVTDATGEARGLLFDLIVAGEAEILTIGVDPPARGQGIARALLADLFARAVAAGADHVLLEVAADNVAALQLYESAGFGQVGSRRAYYTRSHGGSTDAWLLRRNLTE